jgi:hypothetical protein
MRLLDLRCDCGSDDLFSVAPGDGGERFADLFAVERPVPARSWCATCWLAQFAAPAAAGVQAP